MSPQNITFSEVSAGRVLDRVVVRLLRHWHARNINKGGQLLALDLLFVDEKSNVVHGSIGVPHIPAFESKLEDGKLYVLSCFDVSRSRDKYRMCDFHLALRLSSATSLIEIAEHSPEIPKQVFRFRSYADLKALAKNTFDLPDVIGQVCSTKSFHSGPANTLEKVLLFVRLESGEEVRVSAYDDHASALTDVLKTKNKDSCVVVATNINPKIYKDVLYLNATAATKFFFDDEVAVTAPFVERLKKNNAVEKFIRVHKIESMSLAEISNFVLTEKPQDIDFLCHVKVTSIETGRGWNFIACSSCGRKLQMQDSSLICNKCDSTPIVGNVKYRVEIAIEDNSANALFVVFNNDMEKMIKIEASRLVKTGDAGEDAETIPFKIMDIVGKSFTFQIRLSAFNFGPYHQSYTVSRVFVDPEDAPRPSFSQEGSSSAGISMSEATDSSKDYDTTASLVANVKTKKQRIV